MNSIDNEFENMMNRYKGDGAYLHDGSKVMIDAASGTFNLPFGYTHERLANKLKQQIDRCVHLSSAYTRPIANHILSQLTPYLPEGINRIWLRDVSGSGAVEGAIRMAQKYTGRSGVISLFMSHHGQSLATARISGNAFRLQHFTANIDGSFKIPVPTSELAGTRNRTSASRFAELEDFISYASSGNIACLIIEPILGNGGNIVLPVEFYRQVREICSKYNIVVIADEVQTGFGRTGTFFASTGYAKALQPDIIVFAKGAGGIGIPTGGILMKQQLDVLEAYEHSSTSGANPLSLVALHETIAIIEDERLLENVQHNEGYLRNALLTLQDTHAMVSNVRGLGYMFGFDVPDPEIAALAISIAAEQGLIIRGSRYGKGKAIKVRPPLTCQRHHIDEIISKLDRTFSLLEHRINTLQETA
ncbi:aspartate aminotransferase family protein [Erwinia sp. OLTSP20]|uniref:class-III pyridoxal-phosphate-dependent aminotransferase n=1 Tax=unclassified Erwinia TaxID=2622719 RepID=UPI000C198AB6|nr:MULTISPECIES: aspartate aminotransferase family protein [unclassified Erwinia]PIJ49150.1 aspartate aminotransferase family protein [Erwinia sp. OAMSP11]PIJ70460.1 aspartate aminotransferase family protein [Erwinia sp. OLSSP12]PIJ79953.1 aspartate aminotransferase family protein [Erwinia sp. OLCASP19]PIJ81315.1 aspartate aminotransferase family protein [Erwinia sp. OLMTSP26]PIJ83870.1 aspartate aminotransferase family protein [Erwinia sp. OLMDSP33]